MAERITLSMIVGEWDLRLEPSAEHDIGAAIRSLRDKDDKSEPPFEWLAEAMAFDFLEDDKDKDSGWGTYFGPMMVWKNQDGTAIESPSIKHVTPEMLDYWARRAREAKHPIMRARYAGLVWEFTRAVTGQPADAETARIRIDSLLDVAARDLHKHETDVIAKLEHALTLAARLNDAERLERVRDTILAYEDRVADDDKLGLWGFSYDLLCKKRSVQLGLAPRIIEGGLRKCLKSPWMADIGVHGTEALPFRRNGRSVEADRAVDPAVPMGRTPAHGQHARGGQCDPLCGSHRLFVASTAA